MKRLYSNIVICLITDYEKRKHDAHHGHCGLSLVVASRTLDVHFVNPVPVDPRLDKG